MIPAYALNIYSSQALIPARVKSFHTFPEKKRVKPTKPTAACTDQTATACAKYSNEALFFS